MPLFKRIPAKLVYSASDPSDFYLNEEDGPQSDICLKEIGADPDKEKQPAIEETDRIPRELVVERYHLVCFAFSILSYLSDFVTDVTVAVEHYIAGRFYSWLFVSIFVFVPSILLNIISFAWICDDNVAKKKKRIEMAEQGLAVTCQSEQLESGWLHAFLCITQVGPIWWHYKALMYAIKFRSTEIFSKKREYFARMIEAERDATLLRFLEGFLESAPQLLVQAVILVQYFILEKPASFFGDLPRWAKIQMFSMCISVFSMSWALTSQHRTLRMARHDKVNMHPHETVLQLIWRMLTIISRYLVLCTLVTVAGFLSIPLIFVHYMLSLTHISALQLIETGTNSRILDTVFLFVNGAIHIFTPFNMAEGRTRYRYFYAYLLELTELVALFLYVLTFVDSFNLANCFFATSFLTFVLGISTMFLYYWRFHPNRRRHSRIMVDLEDGSEQK